MVGFDSTSFNKGGLTMEKQMELFEDGGLNQEGGMVDTMSGNDVPIGSTRAEVRDDIPAMLSQGEFVFPADVVRYFGLERLMEMRQQAKMGLKKMEAMGQMGNSEEATMPDDLPFSPEDLMFEGEDDDMEGYAAGGLIKAQQGAFVPNPMTGVGGYQPSMFNDGSMNIAPATMATPSGTVPSNATGTATGYLPSFVNQPVPSTVAPVTSTTTTGTTGTAPAPTTPADTPFVPEVGNVYTFKKYINPTTNEIRDIPFYFNDPVIPIPDGFIPYDATAQAEQQPTDVGVQTTQMLQDEGNDSEPMPTPEPVDYSKMGADEIMQAYKNNQTASAIMMGVGAAFPPVGLFGAWATNRERNKIVERMNELGLEVPEGGFINNIVSGITNLFTGKKEEPAATTTRTTGGGTGAARPAAATTPATTQVVSRPETPIGGGMPAAAPTTTRLDVPVGGGMPAAKEDKDFFAEQAQTKTAGKTALASSVAKGQTQDIVNAAMDRAEKDAISKSVTESKAAGKSYNETVNTAAKAANEARDKAKETVTKEAAKVTQSLENLSRGVKTGFNKGGLAARRK
jgi:hypothetical protein